MSIHADVKETLDEIRGMMPLTKREKSLLWDIFNWKGVQIDVEMFPEYIDVLDYINPDLSFIPVSKKEIEFFYDYAPFSYKPNEETKEEGHQRTAKELAKAEKWFNFFSFSDEMRFEWEVDPDIDSSEFEDTDSPRELYICKMFYGDQLETTIGGIDLKSATDPYKRVIEAEMALEKIDSLLSKSENNA